MTTRHSPLNVLKMQADVIAAKLKAIGRGEPVDGDFAGKVAAARKHGVFKPGIVMDDKVIILEIPFSLIDATGEVALSAYILKLMREERDAA